MAKEQLVLPKDHFSKRVKAQYRNVEEALVREIIQNSLDAGATKVEFKVSRDYDTDETTWSAEDDGCGMTLEEFRAFFLTLGGTNKATHSIGGFGAAKEILAFAWDKWWAKGQGFRVDGEGASNPESIEDFSQLKGFSIGASGVLVSRWDFQRAVNKVAKYCIGMKMQVFLNGDKISPINSRMKVLENFPFGTMYVAGKSASESLDDVGYAIVTHGNLFSCTTYIGGMRMYHLDIKREMSPTEVFTESRDSLLYSISNKVNMAAETLKISAQEKHTAPTCRIFILPTGKGETFKSDLPPSCVNDIPFVGPWAGNIALTYNEIPKELKRDGFSITAEENRSGLPFEFAILRKPGARKKVSENASDLTEPDRTAITAIHVVLAVIAKALGKNEPITGLLLSRESGCHCRVNFARRVVAISPKVVWSGPVNLVDTIIHEYVHDVTNSHGADFESTRSDYVATLGLKYIKLLMEVVSLYRDMGIRVK